MLWTCCKVCRQAGISERGPCLVRGGRGRTSGSEVDSSDVVAPRRDSTPLTSPLVTGASDEKESVRSERSSWVLLEARLAASAPKMDWCRFLQCA